MCAAVMMHLEEIVAQMDNEDTTAGMMRFLIGRFPMVVNNILPDCSPEEIRDILEADPHYFNDLTYDDVVEAGAHIMLVAKELFKKDEPRPGHNDKSKYSHITGCHNLPWGTDVKEKFW